MKFKVEPKDFMIFAIYCVLLLYLCAIAVLNVTSLLNDGVFYGLLPFRAFFPPYLPVTIIVFLVALGAIFASVSSYIFKRDKDSSILNLGLIIKEKSSDGYSKWAKDKDIKSQEGVEKVDPLAAEVTAAGIPLINNGKEIWVDNGEYHNLIIGSTGSGKTQTVVKPMVNLLAKKGESMIITDPKGEIYKYSADYLNKQGYRIIVLNFREPQSGNAWNPLTLPYQYYKSGNTDKAIELLSDVAANILHEPDAKDQFWGISAGDYFSGLALGLFMDAKESEINLNSINVMSTVGEERYAAGSNYIKEYFKEKGEKSTPYVFAANTITAPNETKGSILSTFRQKIRPFSTGEALSEMLSYSDFDMRDIGRGKTAVFMIIHDEKKTYHSLMTIFIKQCYETLIDVAQENGGKLPFRTNFILDEFANMPPLKDVDAMVSAARSRDIRFTFIIQNFAQLNDVYGDNVAEIIKGNCGNIVYLISTEMKALEEISKMCGEVKVDDDKDKNATRPLISITDLQKMKLFETIIIRLRTAPFRTQLEPDFKMNWGIERVEVPYPKRERQEVGIFDIKKFVTNHKNDQMSSMVGNMMGDNPFQMGGFNPFMMPSNNQGANVPNMSMNSNNKISIEDIDALIKNIDNELKVLDEKEQKSRIQIDKKEDAKEKQEETTEKLMESSSEEKDEEFKPFIEYESERQKRKAEEKELKESIKETPKQEIIETPKREIIELDSENKIVSNPFMQGTSYLDNELNKEQKKNIAAEEKKALESLNEQIIPKINVDKDSIIVNDSVVSDDEYFDDFFDE